MKRGPVLVVGCGYLGTRLVLRLRDEGRRVVALVRTPASCEQLVAKGLTVARADLDEVRDLPPLPVAGAEIYYLVPPPPTGDTDPRLARCLDALGRQGHPARVLYLSTTAVYGDRGGAWVNEDAPPRPGTARGRRRLAAERCLRAWGRARGIATVVLRVAGIYGPGRLPLERIRRRLPLLDPAAAPPTNRIHVDDLVSACRAAMERGRDGAIYNVSDGHPAPMADYFNAIADRAGLPRPPLVSAAEAERVLTPGMRAYMRESRRIDNRRLLEELGVRLRYPGLDVGLDACFAAGAE